jgi:hypothetical protein
MENTIRKYLIRVTYLAKLREREQGMRKWVGWGGQLIFNYYILLIWKSIVNTASICHSKDDRAIGIRAYKNNNYDDD